jgi:3-hydroxyisobutyrate dehydrogenase-like beta-hydroxyacid dehydrogenase
MAITTVGLLSPGDMGHTVGGTLHQHGLRVLTCLDGRSECSRALAEEAGLEDVPSLNQLVREADVFLSILVPSAAIELATKIAAALRETGAEILYADCNAIAPRTVQKVSEIVMAAGADFADVGIIGPPPKTPGTRFYASGPGAPRFAELSKHGLDIPVLGDEIGQASGLKMCYGAMTKGTQALATELLVAARAMGLEETLRAEQRESAPALIGWIEKSLPSMPPKAYRWVPEMQEIAACFGDLGLTPGIFNGAAELYDFVAETPIGKESPENRDPNRGLNGVVAALAESLAEPVRS